MFAPVWVAKLETGAGVDFGNQVKWAVVLPPLPRIAGAFRAPTLFVFVASDLSGR